MKFRYTPRAKLEIRRREDWWRENRPEAQNLFSEELIAAITHAVHTPLLAKRYFDASDENARYIPMPRTEYALYYTIHRGEIVLLSVWGSRRKRGPKL